MKKLLIFIFSILFCLFLVNMKADAQSAVTPTNSVTIIGDSLSTPQGAGAYYPTLIPGSFVDAKASQPWSWGITELRSIASNGQLAPILVFEFGTNNSTLSQADIQNVFTLAKGSKVIFVTIYDSADPTRVANVNPILQSAKVQGATIVDWNATASQHPEWFGADGVHPGNNGGYSAYANLIAQAVANVASGTSPTTSSSLGTGVYETDSNIVATRVGNPPETAAGAGFATQLIQDIISSCGKGQAPNSSADIHNANINCLNSLLIDQNVISQLVLSTKTYNALQCVGFVQAVVVGTTGQALDKGGNAVDYARSVPDGYKFIRKNNGDTIQEGDIVIYNNDTYGHIAYVTKAYDNNNFQVAEANFDYAGAVELQAQTVDNPYLLGWLRKQ